MEAICFPVQYDHFPFRGTPPEECEDREKDDSFNPNGSLQFSLPRRSPPRRIRNSSGGSHPLLFRQDNEVASSVFGPSLFVVAGVQRFLFSVTDTRDPIRRDAKGEEIFFRCVSPPLSEGQIVLIGPSLVAMALYLDFDLRIFQQQSCIIL